MLGKINLYRKIVPLASIMVFFEPVLSFAQPISYTLGTISYEPLYNQISNQSDYTSANGSSFKYDLSGNLISATNKNGYTICNYYNKYNKIAYHKVLVKGIRTCPDALSNTNVLTQYNAAYTYKTDTLYLGSVTYNNKVFNYDYYSNGLLKNEQYPDNKAINYYYYPSNQVARVSDINHVNTVYSFLGKNGRVDKIAYYHMLNNPVLLTYTYDKFGRLSTGVLPNGIYATINYDQYNRIREIAYYKSTQKSVLLEKIELQRYSNFNNLTRLKATDYLGRSASETFEYDALNRLTKFTCSGAICPKDKEGNMIVERQYDFDLLNNITSVVTNYIPSAGSMVQSSYTTTYTYDMTYPVRLKYYSKKNEKSQTIVYDNAGNIKSDDKGNTYTYNPLNRMVSANTPTHRLDYQYDYQGRLSSETVDNDTDHPIQYYYANSKLINSVQGGNSASYLLDGSGKKVARYTAGDLSQGNIYLTDQKGSVLESIGVSSNNIEKVSSYTPYGSETKISSSIEAVNPLINQDVIGFNGERSDYYTGFQLLGNGYRAYNPELGRFMQPDMYSPFGKGGINPYVFANNNPIMGLDPSGQSVNFWMNIAFGVVGLLAAAAAPFTAGESVAGAVAMISGILASASSFAGAAAEKTKSKGAAIASTVLGVTGAVLDIMSVATSVYSATRSVKSGVSLSSELEEAAADAKVPSNCFTGETLVLMIKKGKKKQKQIKDIQLGELVVTN